MDITAVTLPVRDLPACVGFYRDVLQFEVEIDPADDVSTREGATKEGAAGVRIGSTVLHLRLAPGTAGDHHLAATVPADRFDEAKRWIAARATLISLDGVDEFEGPASWNSRSVYFEGPDSSVLELIARRDFPSPGGTSVEGPFSAAEIIGLSEVGVAVASVLDAVEQLSSEAGLEVYGERPSDSFGAVGSVSGMIILVSRGRTWFPTSRRTAEPSGVVVEAYGEIAGQHRIGDATLILSRHGLRT